MEDKNILSEEEVDAILKASKSANDTVQVDGNNNEENQGNTTLLNNIFDNVRSDIESKLTVLLKQKIIIENKPITLTKITLDSQESNQVCTIFNVHPGDYSIMMVNQNKFIFLMLNLMYGGQLENLNTEAASFGKIGNLIMEKLNHQFLQSVFDHSKEYGEFNANHIKTTNRPDLGSFFDVEKEHYCLPFSIQIADQEFEVLFYFQLDWVLNVFPFKGNDSNHLERDFWRSMIKSNVVDSYVTISINVNDVTMSLKNFTNLKVGDEIEITDPTMVYVCLNNLKLFRALAGQSNSNIFAKIINQL